MRGSVIIGAAVLALGCKPKLPAPSIPETPVVTPDTPDAPDDVPVVDLDRCFGCAVCATGCEFEAINI